MYLQIQYFRPNSHQHNSSVVQKHIRQQLFEHKIKRFYAFNKT